MAAVDEAHPNVQSRVGGDFSPGFEQLIDIPYLAEPQPGESCDRRGPFTAFVIVGPHSAQRKLSGSEVGCFIGGKEAEPTLNACGRAAGYWQAVVLTPWGTPAVERGIGRSRLGSRRAC